MSSLPARFPRTALINSAAAIESAIQNQLDLLHQRIEESENLGLGNATVKLAARYNTLDEARTRANELRMILWELK